MTRLWAPWRMDYITQAKSAECIFCIKSKSDSEKENLVLFRGQFSFLLLNLYPYSNGHLMIAPYSHTSNISEIDKETASEIMSISNFAMKALEKELKAEGFNFGANLGKVAGAGIEEHIHYHIVPRWAGDTNFMPVLGHTKVIMDGLMETWNNLKPYFNDSENII